MFIEEVTIDGFKSYANKVVVPHFDRHFNAITGLNGTGKSNILDSICFVLGITNLSQVRTPAFKPRRPSGVPPVAMPPLTALTGQSPSGNHPPYDPQVRASSLKELVYKQGNAGVTKATVSITFNNEDKDQSPVGYEDKDQITVTRQVACPDWLQLLTLSTLLVDGTILPCLTLTPCTQVVIGGRNKYLINGHVAQPG